MDSLCSFYLFPISSLLTRQQQIKKNRDSTCLAYSSLLTSQQQIKKNRHSTCLAYIPSLALEGPRKRKWKGKRTQCRRIGFSGSKLIAIIGSTGRANMLRTPLEPWSARGKYGSSLHPQPGSGHALPLHQAQQELHHLRARTKCQRRRRKRTGGRA
jgi:hypothetical protein